MTALCVCMVGVHRMKVDYYTSAYVWFVYTERRWVYTKRVWVLTYGWCVCSQREGVCRERERDWVITLLCVCKVCVHRERVGYYITLCMQGLCTQIEGGLLQYCVCMVCVQRKRWVIILHYHVLESFCGVIMIFLQVMLLAC